MNKNAVRPFRRLAAYLIDWYLCTMVCGAPLMLVNSVRSGLSTLDTTLPMGISGFGWGVVAIAIGVSYYALVPMFWNGQTLGKRLLHIRIVTRNGSISSAGAIILRQVVGILLLEGAVTFPSQLFRELVARLLGSQIADILRVGAVAITLISICMGMYGMKKRMLHDWIAGTMEISETA